MCNVKAAVKNKQLVVYAHKAMQKGIWIKDAAALQNCAFRIDKERSSGYALRCVINKARSEEIDTVAVFKTPEDADRAMTVISNALFSAKDGQFNGDEQVVKAKMPLWSVVSFLILVPATLVLLFIAQQSGYAQLMRTFMGVYWAGMGQGGAGQSAAPVETQMAPQAIQPAPVAAPTVDPQTTGVPLSADAFLNALPQE